MESCADTGLAVLIAPLYTSVATSASNRTPAMELVGMNIGTAKGRSHTDGVLIPQLALLVSLRKRIVIFIIVDPPA